MLTFLFWNIGMNREAVRTDPAFRSRLLRSTLRLVKHWNADVLILAEYTLDPQELLSLLNVGAPGAFVHSRSNEPKMTVFARSAHVALMPGSEGTRFTTRHIRSAQGQSLLLAAVHIPDKSHWSDKSQATEALFINSDIAGEEQRAGHQRTLVIGDFNMNPFEYGMIAAGHFHGVMTRSLAEERQRTVMGRPHSFFFNPIWSLYGDNHGGPSGTYYKRISEPECYFWNMFDQVLLRPDLLPFFPRQRQRHNLRIVTTDGTMSYLNGNGLPNQKLASDHLPLMLRLEL